MSFCHNETIKSSYFQNTYFALGERANKYNEINSSKRYNMDQIKIGKFIAEMRKEQNLTQIDLAELLGVSNKTISKWECGNGMPDYALMENLCEILKINVNELLSGEHLPSKDYGKKAEENIMSLMQESSENYKRQRRELLIIVLGIVAVFAVIVLTIVMWGGVAAIGNFIDMPTFIYVTIITILLLVLAGKFKDFIKAFPLAIKKGSISNSLQMRKSVLAVKTSMIAINLTGLLSFFIAFVISLKECRWGEIETEGLLFWTAIALLNIVYALVVTLVLLPIYIRLKSKLVEE